MAWAKRIFLFLTVNILVVLTLSMLIHLRGFDRYMTESGIDYPALMGFCLVWGMTGAFISLALSRVMAKWMMGVQVIAPGPRDPELQQLVQTVHHLARGPHPPAMPEVGVYDSPELNAFA